MTATPPLFDAHLHILDPRFPLPGNQGYVPPPFTVADYRARLAGVPVIGGAVIAGSFQGVDQAWLTAALRALGPGFVGVAQLPAEVGDAKLLRLAAAGVRGLRFTLHRNPAWTAAGLERLARRVHDLAGWHVEVYADAAALLALRPVLARLPAVSIDHLGLTAAALPTVLDLASRGVWVKASGFGRVDFPPAAALVAIHRVNPQALMFGTDLPGTRAPRPFAAADLLLPAAVLGATAAAAVLRDNALACYRCAPATG